MCRFFRQINIIFIAGMLLWQSCVTTYYLKTMEDYQKEIVQLKEHLKSYPDDERTLRQLGIAYYEIKKYKEALTYLIKALRKNPQNPRANAYLAMALAATNKKEHALKVFKRYTILPHNSQYRELMKGRFLLITREMIQEKIRSQIDHEKQLGAEQLSSKTIAVFPLIYQGSNKEFASLGKGLSEMMITDLSQIHELTVIEPVLIRALIEVLKLKQNYEVEESIAPRFGRLISAGRIIHGAYDVRDINKLQLAIASWNVVNGQFPDFNSKNDVLKNFFKLEKDLVFSIINDIGVRLKPEERKKIRHIPTKNFRAFKSYCMGLAKEDAEQFEAAVKYYQQAIKLDPGFEEAAKKAVENKLLFLAKSGKDKMLASVNKLKISSMSIKPGEKLINNRLQNLANNIGSYFLPGQDSRASSEEASLAGADIGFSDLPEPPRPPRTK